VWLCGDLIAPAFAIDALERGLVGEMPDRTHLAAQLARRLEAVGGFVLGPTPEELAAVVADAAGA
jgi:hypothetical protein